jgi:hypothetical protein
VIAEYKIDTINQVIFYDCNWSNHRWTFTKYDINSNLLQDYWVIPIWLFDLYGFYNTKNHTTFLPIQRNDYGIIIGVDSPYTYFWPWSASKQAQWCPKESTNKNLRIIYGLNKNSWCLDQLLLD